MPLLDPDFIFSSIKVAATLIFIVSLYDEVCYAKLLNATADIIMYMLPQRRRHWGFHILRMTKHKGKAKIQAKV